MSDREPVASAETSEAQIAVHWKEEALIHPSPRFIAQANLADPGVYERFALDNFPECFKEYADLLSWDRYWHTTLDTSDPPCWKWFVGGRINACYNCVDRHLPKYKNKAAIHFVPEPEDEAPFADVSRCRAARLRSRDQISGSSRRGESAPA